MVYLHTFPCSPVTWRVGQEDQLRTQELSTPDSIKKKKKKTESLEINHEQEA